MPPTGKRVTVATIADRLGLSVTTVSFVLNGMAPQYRIADATAERVRRAARRMNYVPNELARSLRHQRSGLVGVIFPHLRNDWAHYVMSGMYDVLEKPGLVPFIVNHRDSPQHESREIDLLIQRRAEAILSNPLAASAASYRRAMDNGVPVVFFGDALAELPDVSYAAWDPADAAIAVKHLRAIGRRRIAYLGIRDRRLITSARNDAVRAALSEGQPPPPRSWFVLARPHEEIGQKVGSLFRRHGERPDALFTLYDDIAFEAMDALAKRGIRVPDDVAVVTLGDSRMSGPRGYNLTVVAAPVRDEGREAAGIVVELLHSPRAAPVHRLVSGGRLIVRGSTSP